MDWEQVERERVIRLWRGWSGRILRDHWKKEALQGQVKNNLGWQKSKIQYKMSKKQDTTSSSSRVIAHVSDSDSI